jgi:hypothetical protein
MKYPAAFALRALLGMLALSASACVSAPIAVPNDPASPTGGLGLQLWFCRADTRQYENFRVSVDGTLSYGGGMKAFDRQFEWNGALTPEEATRVRAIVDAAKWLTAEDPALHTAEVPLAEITVSNGEKDRNFNIQGPNEAVVQLAELLSKAAQRRFERFMQRLPDAGTQIKP